MPSRNVQLRNGTNVDSDSVSKVMVALREIKATRPPSFHQLVSLVRDGKRTSPLSNSDHNLFADKRFLEVSSTPTRPVVHELTRQIIDSAVTEDGSRDIRNPLADAFRA
jgi:hypothetical protein